MTIEHAQRLCAQILREPHVTAELIETYKRGVQNYNVRVTHKPRQRTVLLTSIDEWDSVRDAWRQL